MTRARLKDQADASLEIVSIGSLYSGPWDKKYWSSSRGKDRYPYPVGYQAVRAYNGIKYKMEVHEGPKGPLFMILSMDGRSFSGQTPDIAWDMFQKKGCINTKIWNGKRSSCKVDGVEFFGFKNPFIQRLLRELVANVSGTAELDLLPSNLCNKASGSADTAVEHHFADECESAELVSCHEKLTVARKRSRSHGIETAKSPSGANLKKVRNHGSRTRPKTAKLSSSVSVNEVNSLAAVTATSIEKAMCAQEKDAISESPQVAHNVSIDEKPHDRFSMEKLEGISREMETDDNSAIASFQKDCPDTEDNNHHASDTPSIDKLEGISREMDTDDNSAVASFPKDCPDSEDNNNHASNTKSIDKLEGISREMETNDNNAVASFQKHCRVELDCPDTEDNNHHASDTSSMGKLEGIGQKMETDDNSATASFQKDCPDTEDNNHHASDTPSIDKLKGISREIETDDNSAFASFPKDCPDSEDNNHHASNTKSIDKLVGISQEMETNDNNAVASFQKHCRVELDCPDTEDNNHHASDTSSMGKLKGIGQKMETDDNNAIASFEKDCPDTEDNNHDSSDTSDLKQVSLGKKNLNQPNIIIPDELVMDSNSEEICSLDMNSGSKTIDFDSVGQDMVKSMMTFLLPQAIPLLKETSGRKKTATSNLETLPCDGNTKDVLHMENEDREKQEYMYIQHGNCKYDVPSLELPRPCFDNLDSEQHYDHANVNENFSSIVDNGRAEEDMKPIDSCRFPFRGHMNDELLVNNQEVTGSKKTRDSGIGENLPGTCQEGNLYVSECPPSSTSSGRVIFYETMHTNKRIDECTLNLQLNSWKVGQRTPKDYTESNGDEQPCSSGSFSQFSNAQNANDSSVRSTSAYSEANKEFIAGKEDAGIDTLPSSQSPSIVYSRRKARNASHLAKEYNRPSDEAYNTSCLGKHYGAETSSTKSPHSSDFNYDILPGKHQREDLLSEPTLGEQSPINGSYKTTMKAEAGLEKICPSSPTSDLDEAPLRASKNHNLGLLDKPVSKKDLEGCVDEEMIEHNYVLSTNKYELSHDMGATFRDTSKDSFPRCNVELYREAEGMSKIVGSYLHPMPILSIFLSNIENVIHICVLCGLPVEKNRTLVTYTVEVEEPRLGYPSLVGHTTVMVPTLRDYLGKEIAVERTGFQLTPDGNYLVMIGGIRAPFCRTGSINCSCSTCTSSKLEEDVVKIVQIKYGYVSIRASLKSADNVHCLLVCEPDQLVAVGRGGRLHLWVMDSTWGKQIASHTIPSADHVSPNLVELKRIPEFSNLVLGHNGYGEFSLWDISKRALMSRFFTPSASVNQFFPISLFSWKRTEKFTSNFNSMDNVKELLCATDTSSKNTEEHSSFQLKDSAIWLFASTILDSHDSHDYLPMDIQINHAELWKLALLANSTVTFGAELDLRATAIGASAGRGIIGTQDGLVYVWELSTGNKLGTLLSFEGASAFCIATDNREAGVVAVAADNRLLVYLLSSDGKR